MRLHLTDLLFLGRGRHYLWLGSALVVLVLNTVAPALAADATVYKIRNRWLSDQVLCDRDGKLAYGKGDGGEFNWTLEDGSGIQRIKNVGTGSYAVLDLDGTNVFTSKALPADARGSWVIETGTDSWSSIQNFSNHKYVNCERKKGFIECDAVNRPQGDQWWAGQWEFIHVGGPLPPKRYRNQEVAVVEPAYGATIAGETSVTIKAPGLNTAIARCWKQGDGFGADSVVATITLDNEGNGKFVFPAKAYPHGPVMIRISGSDGKKTNNCNLQLYNTAGIKWNEGVPAKQPPAAEGMKLLFADDFSGPLSISKTGAGATYASHKPGGGDFSSIPFVDHVPGKSPFSQMDSYMRIRIDAKAKSAGLISALRMDGTGITATVPCYFECRMTAQSAPGTWPAFWLMTRDVYKGLKEPSDELDTIEAYGGEGKGSPNSTGYWICTHYWNQGDADKKQPKIYKQIELSKLGGGGSWYATFHVYGTKITEEDTIYYCDNIEVGRHPTGKLSKTQPWFFFVNYATGGGWPVDLSRYDGIADMYVDWVRVYQK